MEFSVIGTFILLMEERFCLVLIPQIKFYKHNRTTNLSLYQFNQAWSFLSFSYIDRQIWTLMKYQTISLNYIFEDFVKTSRTEARFIM